MLTALAATLLAFLTLPMAAPLVAERPAETDQTIVRVDTPAWEGEFTAQVVPVAGVEKSVRVTLNGTMKGKLPNDLPYTATIVLTCPVAEDAVIDTGETRLVSIGGVRNIYLVEDLAPDATIWSRVPAGVGTMEVWNTPYQTRHLSESVIVSLFNTMVLDSHPMLEGQSEPCNPSFSTCRTSACSPIRIGSLTYECDNGEVTCSWTCLETLPE